MSRYIPVGKIHLLCRYRLAFSDNRIHSLRVADSLFMVCCGPRFKFST